MKFINQAKAFVSQKWEQVKEGARTLAIVGAVGVTSAVGALPQPVQAALQQTDIDPVTTEIGDDASLVFLSFIGVVGTVLAMTIGIKLLKRFGNKV